MSLKEKLSKLKEKGLYFKQLKRKEELIKEEQLEGDINDLEIHKVQLDENNSKFRDEYLLEQTNPVTGEKRLVVKEAEDEYKRVRNINAQMVKKLSFFGKILQKKGYYYVGLDENGQPRKMLKEPLLILMDVKGIKIKENVEPGEYVIGHKTDFTQNKHLFLREKDLQPFNGHKVWFAHKDYPLPFPYEAEHSAEQVANAVTKVYMTNKLKDPEADKRKMQLRWIVTIGVLALAAFILIYTLTKGNAAPAAQALPTTANVVTAGTNNPPVFLS